MRKGRNPGCLLCFWPKPTGPRAVPLVGTGIHLEKTDLCRSTWGHVKSEMLERVVQRERELCQGHKRSGDEMRGHGPSHRTRGPPPHRACRGADGALKNPIVWRFQGES